MTSEFTDKEFADHLCKARTRLLSFLLTRTFDYEKAKDLLADASIKALQAWRDGKYNREKNETNFYPWMATICVNMFIDRYRQDSKKPGIVHITGENETGETEIQILDTEASPAEQMLQAEDEAEQVAVVEYLLDTVTDPLTREIIRLRCWENKKFWEIADLLNMEMVTVKGIFWKECNHLRALYAVHKPYIRAHAVKKMSLM